MRIPVVIVRQGYPGMDNIDAMQCAALIDSLGELAASRARRA